MLKSSAPTHVKMIIPEADRVEIWKSKKEMQKCANKTFFKLFLIADRVTPNKKTFKPLDNSSDLGPLGACELS